MTDTGQIPYDAHQGAEDADVLFVESNYDREMLKNGPYYFAGGDLHRLTFNKSLSETRYGRCWIFWQCIFEISINKRQRNVDIR